MKKKIKIFFGFVKKPTYEHGMEKSFYNLFFYPMFFLIVIFFISILISLMKYHFEIDLKYKSNLISLNKKKNFIYFIIVFAPLFEELVCRAILKPKKINFVLFILSLTLFVCLKLFDNYLLSIFISLIISTLVYFYKFKFNIIYYKKYYKSIVYFSSFVFGIVHVFNFQSTTLILLLSPILMLPQIIGGFSLAFIRVKFGLIYAILFHSLYNAIPFVIKYFLLLCLSKN